MVLRLLSTAVDIYRKNGFLTVILRVFKFISSDILSGGISSRRWVEPISGLLRPFYNIYFRIRLGKGTNIIEEDWDTLILLDACRFDDFRDQNDIDGTLECRLSNAADSREFIEKNVQGKTLHDTVYVTANPHVDLVNDGTFHAVLDDPLSEWDDELRCVKPEEVTATALRAHEEFEDKRIIVHYMQPHDPPLGETANRLREEIEFEGVRGDSTEGVRFLDAVSDGSISVETARQAYRETLSIVLDEVDDLLSNIEGRVVVSADHGEMFGEQPYPILGKLYEHYRHPHTKELCCVPWMKLHQNSRREIEPEAPVEGDQNTTTDLQEQLEALGYK